VLAVKQNLLKAIVVLIFVLFSFILISNGQVKAFNLPQSDLNLSRIEDDFQKENLTWEKYLLDTTQLVSPVIKRSRNVKGIYINSSTLSSSRKIEALLELIKTTVLNAVVIDIKNIEGKVMYTKESGVGYNRFQNIIKKFKQEGTYVIGRLTVFKDYKLAGQEQYSLKYSLTSNSQAIIESSKWTDPTSKEVWDYNIKIAQKAINFGVDEIQFDYVRYPSLSAESKLVIKVPGGNSKSETIINFLKYARRKLKQDQILISADVFGLTTTIEGDLGIGQNIVRMVKHIDYLSPMIYPSHYNQGIYGIQKPSAQPYQIITKSLADAKEKLEVASYKLRPWLQDFSLKNIYAKKEIKAQIKAVQDKQLTGWLLWNPASNYTIEALLDPINERE